MTDLFSFIDYRAYLRQWISEQPKQGRGLNSALAKAARCQAAYFSRMLQGRAQLSLEQAYCIQKVLNHSFDETSYFIWLVEWDRAGDPGLKNFWRGKIEAAQQARTDLQRRFKDAKTLSPEHQNTYYSSAHYLAVHMCITVATLQTLDALESLLKLPRERLQEVLSFLVDTGLAIEVGGKYKVGRNRLHLGRASNLIRQHHSNWRIEALKSLDRGKGAQGLDDLHYSAVVSLSHDDATRLKELWIQTLEQFNAAVAPSREETVRALVIDFFALG